MKIIKTWRDPYDMGFFTCYKKEVELKPGLTVLVGCNGAGKTTLLKNIKFNFKDEGIAFLYFDNLNSGKPGFGMQAALDSNNIGLLASLWSSSEGESIVISVGNSVFGQLREYLKTGETKESRSEREWSKAFHNETIKRRKTKERFILMDASDSGMSIDNVIEIKELIHEIIDCNPKLDIYFLIAANEYEMADGEDCLDVTTGKYVRFKNYTEYKSLILKTREKKDKRYERLQKKGK